MHSEKSDFDIEIIWALRETACIRFVFIIIVLTVPYETNIFWGLILAALFKAPQQNLIFSSVYFCYRCEQVYKVDNIQKIIKCHFDIYGVPWETLKIENTNASNKAACSVAPRF